MTVQRGDMPSTNGLLIPLRAANGHYPGGSSSRSPKELHAFGIGAVINIFGLPFALAYCAAIDQILKADLTVIDSVIVLAGYNLGYALPFLVVPALALALGDRSRPVLARINDKVARVSAHLMPWMLALLGTALVVDAIRFFAIGEGLF